MIEAIIFPFYQFLFVEVSFVFRFVFYSRFFFVFFFLDLSLRKWRRKKNNFKHFVYVLKAEGFCDKTFLIKSKDMENNLQKGGFDWIPYMCVNSWKFNCTVIWFGCFRCIRTAVCKANSHAFGGISTSICNAD